MKRLAGFLVVSMLVLVGAARAQRAEPADAPVASLGGDLSLGRPIHEDNVTVWPVYSSRPVDAVDGEMMTLAEAQDKGLAVVREQGAPRGVAAANADGPAGNQAVAPRVDRTPRPRDNVMRHLNESQQLADLGDVGGSVNELVLDNLGTKPILVLAGTLLKGGKQDRQVGQDFVVPPGKTVPVAAFCVEHGRWTASRDGVATKGVFKAQKALAPTKVRGNAQYKSDQGAVWDQVAKENENAGKAPSSGTLLAAVEDSDPAAAARRAKVVKRLSEQFAALAASAHPPVGMAWAIGGKVREVRVFSHPVLLQRLVETLINSVAVEADLDWRQAVASKHRPVDGVTPTQAVVDLVNGARAASLEKVKTGAGNVLGVRKSASAWNSDCFQSEGDARPVTQSFMNAL